MYLATRMPQLSGLYAELWLTRLIESPYTASTLFIFISLLGVAHAEQTTTVKFLMTEPLTLFDLGIYKLNKLINEDPFINATIKYDTKSNKINIHVVMHEWFVKKGASKTSRNKGQAYNLIDSMVKKIRTRLGVDYQTGNISSDNTALEDCFRPASGRVIRNVPEGLKEDLFKMIEIAIRFSGQLFKRLTQHIFVFDVDDVFVSI